VKAEQIIIPGSTAVSLVLILLTARIYIILPTVKIYIRGTNITVGQHYTVILISSTTDKLVT